MIFIIWLNAEIMDLMNLYGANFRFNGLLAGERGGGKVQSELLGGRAEREKRT